MCRTSKDAEDEMYDLAKKQSDFEEKHKFEVRVWITSAKEIPKQ